MQRSLKDWLWRLDCIQEELERLPSGNAYILFTLKIDLRASCPTELENWLLHDALSAEDRAVPNYRDPDTGALWWELGHLGRGGLPFVMCWDHEDLSVHDSMPQEFFAKKGDGPSLCESLVWCRWYYLLGNGPGKASELMRIASRIIHAANAALAACDLAPRGVLRELGNLSAFGCWATALFYLGMKRLHPLIQAFGRELPNQAFASDHDPDKDSSFSALNDLIITLSPDLRSATRHAFDLFRQTARDELGIAENDEKSGDARSVDRPKRPVEMQVNVSTKDVPATDRAADLRSVAAAIRAWADKTKEFRAAQVATKMPSWELVGSEPQAPLPSGPAAERKKAADPKGESTSEASEEGREVMEDYRAKVREWEASEEGRRIIDNYRAKTGEAEQALVLCNRDKA